MLTSKLKVVMLAVLIVSVISCTKTIPVRLELPDEPGYYHDISSGVIVNQKVNGEIIDFNVTLEAMQKLTKNKVLCREYSSTLRQIIKTTH